LIGVLTLNGWTGWCPISSSTFGRFQSNMTDKEKREQVQQTLDYMIAEGMVKKVGNGYRLKTERELEQEMALYDE